MARSSSPVLNRPFRRVSGRVRFSGVWINDIERMDERRKMPSNKENGSPERGFGVATSMWHRLPGVRLQDASGFPGGRVRSKPDSKVVNAKAAKEMVIV